MQPPPRPCSGRVCTCPGVEAREGGVFTGSLQALETNPGSQPATILCWLSQQPRLPRPASCGPHPHAPGEGTQAGICPPGAAPGDLLPPGALGGEARFSSTSPRLAHVPLSPGPKEALGAGCVLRLSGLGVPRTRALWRGDSLILHSELSKVQDPGRQSRSRGGQRTSGPAALVCRAQTELGQRGAAMLAGGKAGLQAVDPYCFLLSFF